MSSAPVRQPCCRGAGIGKRFEHQDEPFEDQASTCSMKENHPISSPPFFRNLSDSAKMCVIFGQEGCEHVETRGLPARTRSSAKDNCIVPRWTFALKFRHLGQDHFAKLTGLGKDSPVTSHRLVGSAPTFRKNLQFVHELELKPHKSISEASGNLVHFVIWQMIYHFTYNGVF